MKTITSMALTISISVTFSNFLGKPEAQRTLPRNKISEYTNLPFCFGYSLIKKYQIAALLPFNVSLEETSLTLNFKVVLFCYFYSYVNNCLE